MKNEIKNKMLNDEQASTVKQMILDSMRSAYTSMGSLPDEGFLTAASTIADKIIKNTQMVLMQKNVYKKIVQSSKPGQLTKKKNVRK